MFKGHFNRAAFIKARVAQTVEHQDTHLKVVGSSPTVGKDFIGRSVPYQCNHAWHSSGVIGAQRE